MSGEGLYNSRMTLVTNDVFLSDGVYVIVNIL